MKKASLGHRRNGLRRFYSPLLNKHQHPCCSLAVDEGELKKKNESTSQCQPLNAVPSAINGWWRTCALSYEMISDAWLCLEREHQSGRRERKANDTCVWEGGPRGWWVVMVAGQLPLTVNDVFLFSLFAPLISQVVIISCSHRLRHTYKKLFLLSLVPPHNKSFNKDQS